MTDAQTKPPQDASTHGRKPSNLSFTHQAPPSEDLEHEFSGLEPPEFHCSVCDGTGSLMPHDEWKPEVCWSCNGKD